jgi:uncharacterized protein (TIRG00374 family)
LTKAFRWYLLVNSSGARVSFRRTFPFYIIALAINNITPGKIGGEPVRAYLLNKEADVPIGQGIASIFTEKILDIIVITTMAIIGAVFIIPLLTPNEGIMLIFILILVIIAIISAIIIVSNSSFFKKTVDKSVKIAKSVSNRESVHNFADSISGFAERFRYGLKEISKTKKYTAACTFLTVMIWINEALRLFIILLALPDVGEVNLGAVFIASSIANLLGIAIPFGAGNILGIGTVFIAVGIGSGTAGAASFLHVATSIWISVPLGVIAMLITGFRLSKMNNNKKGPK